MLHDTILLIELVMIECSSNTRWLKTNLQNSFIIVFQHIHFPTALK